MTPAGVAGGRLFTTWITSLGGGVEARVDHAVTDEEWAARTVEHRGVLVAVCGAAFLPGPMEDGPAPLCPRCVAFLRARTTVRDVSERMDTPQPGWLSRLLGSRMRRRELPAGADGTMVFPDASVSAGVQAPGSCRGRHS